LEEEHMEYPQTSRVAVLRAFGGPLAVEEIAVPELEPAAVLAAVEVATVCGTDAHIWRGRATQAKLPAILGHEMVGRIIALGGARRTDALGAELREGDRIVWAYGFCGDCYWCSVAKQPTLCAQRQAYGWGPCDRPPYLLGGFAEYVYILPTCKILRVQDESCEPAVLASATCALRTVIHAFDAVGALRPHETVVIQGSGPVGLYAVAFAHQSGAGRVICVGAPEARLDVATEWGAAETIDVMTTGAAERIDHVLRLTEGRGADVVVECSGAPGAFGEGLGMVRRGGRYGIVGPAGAREERVDVSAINLKEITVSGVVGGELTHYFRAVEFVRTKASEVSFTRLLGDVRGLAEATEAVEAMDEQREIKPIIVPHE
jgi:L-iditol 2-dehydrogenase